MNSERKVTKMFAYVQIFNGKNNVSYGYVDLSFSKNVLSVSALKGNLREHNIKIPASEISDISSGKYQSWNQMSFMYQGLKYVFIYSGYGGYNYLEDHLMTEMIE
ncbi:hypothetical protein [Companilactobacillus paralimentarius]|jgi:hypothetical protein|nr:hypothetical protein [Companilactobacillus paralimentarius]